MSTGFKAIVGVASWFILALAPGALAEEQVKICDGTTVGKRCYTTGGVDGVCMPTPDSIWDTPYSCFEQESGSATSDPVISGFDGKSFHFDQTGDFTLLSSGDGFKVEVTLMGAAAATKEETSWTSSVRFIATNVTSMLASSPAQGTTLSFAHPTVELADMMATAVLDEDGQVRGCQVTTARLHATVYQVSGYKQALLHPEEEWAAPYTWLNTDIKLKKPLPAPVTGVLGATYPVSKDTEAAFLRALEDSPAGLEAAVVGESGMRRLAGSAGPFFLHSSVVGIARPQNY
ncbi:hypothetical protein N2152v2_008159 [Parachlorella kessleri]